MQICRYLHDPTMEDIMTHGFVHNVLRTHVDIYWSIDYLVKLRKNSIDYLVKIKKNSEPNRMSLLLN